MDHAIFETVLKKKTNKAIKKPKTKMQLKEGYAINLINT